MFAEQIKESFSPAAAYSAGYVGILFIHHSLRISNKTAIFAALCELIYVKDRIFLVILWSIIIKS